MDHVVGLTRGNPARAEVVPLVEKQEKVTCAALVTANPPKAVVLMMGGNHLPGESGLRLLSAALRSTH